MWPIGGLGLTNVRLFDPTLLVCPERMCDTERHGMVLYSDSHHLTATFARTLAPGLAGVLALTGSSSNRSAESH